jgi:hypothetical protein
MLRAAKRHRKNRGMPSPATFDIDTLPGSSNLTALEAAAMLQQRDPQGGQPRTCAKPTPRAEAHVWAGPSEAIADQKPRVREGSSAAESIWTNQQTEGVLMSRRPARFTQGDVARAIRAAKAAGAPSLQIKPDGTIIVDLLKSTAVQESDEAVEPEEHFVL